MTARDADGAPIFGGVSDPAETSGPVNDMELPGMWESADFEGGAPDEVRGPDWVRPRYTPAIVFSCPDCFGDLQDEGRSWYFCPACQRGFPPAEVAVFDETDYERE